MIELNRSVTADLDQTLRHEWLETNGLGGYAAGTVGGANTRRYHALLVAAKQPPVARSVLFSKLDEVLCWPGVQRHLSCNIYGGAIYPAGYNFLDSFRLDPWPVFTYRVGSCVLEKHILMRHGHNTTLVNYRLLRAQQPCTLRVRLFVASRNHHHLQSARTDFDTRVCYNNRQLRMQPREEWSRLFVWFGQAEFWSCPGC